MTQVEGTRQVEVIVRAVASAGKALKLYPAASPIPRQTVETAAGELAAFFDTYPLLSLSVVREGFTWSGSGIGSGAAGVDDLASELREHGVAELDFLPGCSVEDLVGFLTVISRETDEVRGQGGASAALVGAGVEGIRVTDVHLTVIEEVLPAADEDIEEFLRSLAVDSDKLAAWLAAASSGDARTFEEGLIELSEAVGPGGLSDLTRTLATAFLAQEHEGKDAILGLSLEPGVVRDLASSMFGHLESPDIASALCDGLFGSNMLALSNALTNLPLAERMRQIYADVQGMLPDGGHTDKEVSFLEHMMEVRAKTEPETPLTDADSTYLRVAEAMNVSSDEVEDLRKKTSAATRESGVSGVNIMLALLDQQKDFELYAEGVDHLATMVPRLIDSGDIDLALRVVNDLAVRESRTSQPWPELTDRLRKALARALGQSTMTGLLKAAIADETRIATLREFLRHADDNAVHVLAGEAIALKHDGLDVADKVLGRRMVDLLIAAVPNAQWFQVEPIVARLARETDPRAQKAIEAVIARPDEQSRREAAQGLAAGGGPAASRLLSALMRDSSAEVAMIAIRAVSKHDMPSGARLLSERLGEIDVDGKDFLIAREIIGSLARLSDPEALEVLNRLASRKSLMKRGHFSDVQELVRQALEVQRSRGGAR